MSGSVVVNEIYLSLQGESTHGGLPCVFIRLTGCDLRCSYCDSAYAFTEGRRMTFESIIAEVQKLAAPFPTRANPDAARWPLVELTGGEPLLQKNCLELMRLLCDDQFVVLIETSGAHDISAIDPRVRRIMDLKCPSSGEAARNRMENVGELRASDEVKFVIGTVEDYEWAKERVAALKFPCPILFSFAAALEPSQRSDVLKRAPADQRPMSRRELAERILVDALPVRFQVQTHKVIWPADARGV